MAVQVGGLLLVAPEHRLSLQLKRDELHGRDRAACGELDRLADMPYVDLMDEVDMLLHHKCVPYVCGMRGTCYCAPGVCQSMEVCVMLMLCMCGKGGGACVRQETEGLTRDMNAYFTNVGSL